MCGGRSPTGGVGVSMTDNTTGTAVIYVQSEKDVHMSVGSRSDVGGPQSSTASPRREGSGIS